MDKKEVIIIKVNVENKRKRIDQFLNERYPEYSRNYIEKLIKSANFTIENNKIKKSYKLKGNEAIYFKVPKIRKLHIKAENIPLNIIYQDNDIAIINKPYNMVVHPATGVYTGTLVNAIMHHMKDLSTINGTVRPGIVHRLDKNTSGAIIIAKNDVAHKILCESFKNRSIEKTYIAICKGIFKIKKDKIETLIARDPKNRTKMFANNCNGKIATSNYEVISESNNFSLVKIKIETGRTHQIRAHMKYINHSILGDEIYGSKSRYASRQMLHAYKLKFNHPISKKVLYVSAPVLNDFMKTLVALNFCNPDKLISDI